MSGSIQGNAGFAASDTLCQNEATNAGRAGTYRALLAGNGATAASRLSATGAPWSTASTSAAMTYGNRMGTDWFGPFTSGLCSDLHRVFCFQQ